MLPRHLFRKSVTSRPTPVPQRRRFVRTALVIENLEDRTMLSATPTATTLTSDVAQAVFGQPVTLYALVATNPPGPTTATGGTVKFMEGTTTLGTATLCNGTATLITTLPVGEDAVSAVYSGDGSQFGGSSSGIVSDLVTVGAAPTTTVVTASNSAPVSGESVTFTDSVTANAPSTVTPTGGTVAFADGSQILGSANVVNGAATFSMILGLGRHSVAATYSGGGVDFGPSVSQNPGLIVNEAGRAFLGGFAGDGGPATNALIWGPDAIAVDAQGTVYFADSVNHVIRIRSRLTASFLPSPAPTWQETRVMAAQRQAATFGFLTGLAIDSKGGLIRK